jgi:hypothetical protein
MSVNKYQPHVLLLPEDDANTELANGFVLEVKHIRRIQILPEAGGWKNACETFFSEHVKGMYNYSERYFVLPIDFDDQADRAANIKERIPHNLRNRVFLIGTKTEPEALKQAGLGSLESIGRHLAKECRDGNRDIWSHDLLRQNASEVDRLDKAVGRLLFE